MHFADAQGAKAALEALNGYVLEGEPLTVEYAKDAYEGRPDVTSSEPHTTTGAFGGPGPAAPQPRILSAPERQPSPVRGRLRSPPREGPDREPYGPPRRRLSRSPYMDDYYGREPYYPSSEPAPPPYGRGHAAFGEPPYRDFRRPPPPYRDEFPDYRDAPRYRDEPSRFRPYPTRYEDDRYGPPPRRFFRRDDYGPRREGGGGGGGIDRYESRTDAYR